MFTEILQKMLAYACIGLLIEVFFTGIYSLWVKNWKATGQTYLWMGPIYAITALALEFVSECLPWPFYLKAPVYVLVMYLAEGTSGFLLKKMLGTCPWNYGPGKHAPFGLINLRYAPYWLMLALAFDQISGYLKRILVFVANME